MFGWLKTQRLRQTMRAFGAWQTLGVVIAVAAATQAAAQAVPELAAPQSVTPQNVTPPTTGVTATAPPIQSSLAAKIPVRPEEARAAKAYSVFETHCARCHQTGRTERLLPSGGLSNILDVEALTRDAVIVHPGLPDASRLYDVLATRHAPLDVYSEVGAAGVEPAPEEIEAVREWIADLGAGVQSCHARAKIKASDLDALVKEAQTLERDGARDLRFISLAHLYNACATPDEMAAYRQALLKAVNGLSWSPEPVALTALDPAGAIFAFRLADLSWVAGDWETLIASLPGTPSAALSGEVIATSGSKMPMVNGDWLTSIATSPPHYYKLLRMPASLNELARINGVDMEQDVRAGRVRRAIIRSSAVTRGNRLIDRYPGALGGFWVVYDFATSSGEQNLFAFPLGPKRQANSTPAFKADQVRVLFALPNGFLAAAMFDETGARIDRVIPGIEKAYAGDEIHRAEPGTTAGVNCLSCHATGIEPVRDTFRAEAERTDTPLPKDIRDAALNLISSDSELALLIAGDNDRYRAALKGAGVDPDLRLNGDEIVTALARRYARAGDFETALAESALPRDEFLKLLSDAKGEAAPLARRVQHGLLTRAELNRMFALLHGVAAPAPQTNAGGFLGERATDVGLSMWLEQARPVRGDLITVNVEADTDCYLTVVSVNAEGQATVIFPNEFEPENLLVARVAISLPGKAAPYQLRLTGDTAETLLARCTLAPTPPSGIEHDFERQKFTVLGNWENFIRDTIETEADMRANPHKIEQAQTARNAARRRNQSRAPISLPAAMSLPIRTLRDGRAVLVVGPN